MGFYLCIAKENSFEGGLFMFYMPFCHTVVCDTTNFQYELDISESLIVFWLGATLCLIGNTQSLTPFLNFSSRGIPVINV